MTAIPRGAVVWLTGLSGAGKSTIADALAAELMADGRGVAIVDGDELRRRSAHLGFDAASREANIRRAAELAEEGARDGQIVLVAVIAPFERSRREAREIVEASVPFLLVWVRTPLAVAEARDPKGLYARARAGEIRDFTGIDSPYEEPLGADLVIDTTVTTVPEAVTRIRRALEARLGDP
ncbi:MAG: adenylyl-sulfate kinase [Chloroflexota bacterium]